MKKICVGVLIDVLDGYFERALVNSLTAAAREEGFTLIFFPGRRVNHVANFDRQFNIIYEHARCQRFDAFISATETLQSELSRDQCISFLGRYSGIPLVNLNFEVDGHSSVISDDGDGIQALMQHLIIDHGYTKFAFMRGIESALGAQVRLAAFMRSMSANGLVIDPRLMVTGNFVQTDARVAMNQLLDSNIPFEVLVCANDGMAHSAIEVAVERGLRVPQDIAVTGFDDIFSFSHVGIPLTTIAQPFQQMANAAMRLVKAQLSNSAEAAVIHKPTQLVLRATCGCVAGAKMRRAPSSVRSVVTPADQLLQPLMLSVEDEPVYREHARALLNSFDGDEETFLAKVEEIANTTLRATGTLGQLQHLLLQMCNPVSLKDDTTSASTLNAGLRVAKAQIVLATAQNAFFIAAKDHNGLMEGPIAYKLQDRGTVQNQITGLDRDSMFALIEQSLRALSIPTCYVVLYPTSLVFESLQKVRLPANSQLVFATHHYERLDVDGDQDFPTHDLLPRQLLDRSSAQCLAVFPIFQYSEHYGYLILDISTLPRFELELVREEISSALISGILLTEVSRARDLLKTDLTLSEGHNVRLVDQVMQLNHRLQALFDAALEVAIIATDPLGNIDVFNLGAQKMLGYRADEVIGKSPALFHIPSEVVRRGEELQRQHGRLIEGFEIFVANTRAGVSEIRNWTYIRKDGQPLQVSLVVSAVIGNDGVINGFLGIARDITEQVQAEANLLALNQQLDQRVQQRTQSLAESTEQLNASLSQLKLTQSKLVQSEKLAALGSIVSAVAHELNTPLGNCVTVTSTLQEETLALKTEIEAGGLRRSRLDSYLVAAQTGFQILTRGLSVAASLVDNFKQIAVNQSQAPVTVFNLKEVLRVSIELAMQKSKGAGFLVRLLVPDDLMLESYPGALDKVVDTLVSNSLLHGFEGRSSGQITVTASLCGPRVSIVYQDDGVGMAAPVLEHIYDPFFTTKFGKGGNGLGMSICHNQITGMLRGTIDVQSTPGVGSKFSIDLPASVTAEFGTSRVRQAGVAP